MIDVRDCQVYETVEVDTGTQIAIVTTCKGAEMRVKLVYDGSLNIRYENYLGELQAVNTEVVLRILNVLTNITQKVRVTLVGGLATYAITEPSEYQISVSSIGADGDSIFVDNELA